MRNVLYRIFSGSEKASVEHTRKSKNIPVHIAVYENIFNSEEEEVTSV